MSPGRDNPQPKTAMNPPAKAKKKTTFPYTALLEKVKTAKSKATAIRKSKKQKTNNMAPSSSNTCRHQHIVIALVQPSARVDGEAPPDGAVVSRVHSSLSSVSRSSFVTLNSRLWLTKNTINYVARSVIQPG